MNREFQRWCAGIALAAGCGLTAPALGGGINLSWQDCGTSGSGARTSACASNAGANVLIVSVIPPAPMPQFNGAAVTIDLQTTGAALSPWWHMESGGCRSGSLLWSADFSVSDLNGDPIFHHCMDPWGGRAGGGSNFSTGPLLANRARIRGVAALSGNIALDNVSEAYMMQLKIANAGTVDPDGCAGCLDGACLVLQSVQLTQPLGVGDFIVTNPLQRQHVTWQASGGSIGLGCPNALPTRNATWGAVKSLYR